ncbi:MAG: hypothetical protein NZL85_03795 [Fimbriimonadales bacterium]|nr:hypothetical protein [Fimbriimonadales bacterium]
MNIPFVLVCLAIIALLVWMAYRNIQRLNRRIEEFDEERAQHPLDPFSALAELYRLQENARRRRK